MSAAVRTTCCYCGVGCGVTARVEDGKLQGVAGDQVHPANFGRLCVKGSALAETQDFSGRLLYPSVHGERVDWDTALGYTAERFAAIIAEHGPDAVAFYLSGQLLTEDYYVANKLVKGFLGTANVDTNSRLCMASAVAAHKRAFGGDLVPGCYQDLELADLLILVGSNTAYAHPVVYQRIAQAKRERPGMKVVVIDPRRTETCAVADLHLQLAPGTDAILFNGLLAHLAAVDALDSAFIAQSVEGFSETLTAAQADAADIAITAARCDLDARQLAEFFQWFADTAATVTVFSQGINQSTSGTDKGNAIINCHLATGRIGKPGACPFSITGQPNAMGGREVGGLANQLAAHMDFSDPANVALVAGFWSAPQMASAPGLKAVELFDAIDSGRVKAVWIMATNPAVSLPDAARVRRALAQCELVVVSECVADTDTAALAHVLLPATTWSEKHGTVTNSERCISLQRGFLPAPGEALHDWQIICGFAAHMGFGDAFSYPSAAAIFREHAELSGLANGGKRGFDISALARITDAEYEDLAPLQWPVTPLTPQGTRRLFSDGRFFTASGRARCIPISARPAAAEVAAGELLLNTGRVRDQWHTMSRTGSAAKLLAHRAEPFIEAHPQDAAARDLQDGQLAVISNRGHRFIGRLQISESQRPGELFAPIHWNDKFASAGTIGKLIAAEVDPVSGQPEFKQTAVQLTALNTAWEALLFTELDLRPDFDYFAKLPAAHGWQYRLGHGSHVDWPAWMAVTFGAAPAMQLQDSGGGFYHAAITVGGRVTALCYVNRHRPTVDPLFAAAQLGQPLQPAAGFALLAGAAGAAVEDPGALICSCFGVGERAVRRAVEAGADTPEALGRALRCGTNCGSCIPELQNLLRQAQSVAVV